MADARSQIKAAMDRLIATREDFMVDECSVARPATLSQTPELDADGMVIGADDGEPVYAGRCTFSQPSDAEVQAETANDHSGVPVANTLRVPHGAGLQPGDVVTATAALISPSLVGDVFVVVRQSEKTYASSERYFLRGSSWRSAPTGG